MLLQLQQQLSDIYQVSRTYDVRDYVITDPILAKFIGQDAMLSNTDETLLVSQDDDGLALSLYLDGEMLERLAGAGLDNLPSNLAFITGPSKTGDIELQLTTGVHGPGRLHAVVIRGDSSA